MFTHFHRLLQLFGGRCIIVEEGEARYVVLPIKEYLALSGKSSDDAGARSGTADDEQSEEDATESVRLWRGRRSETTEEDGADDGAIATEDESSADLAEDIGRGRNKATDETAVWAGEADDAWSESRLSGQNDASPFPPSSSPASPTRGASEEEAMPKAMEPIPERPRSEYRIEDIPF